MKNQQGSLRLVGYEDIEHSLPIVVDYAFDEIPDLFVCALGFEKRTLSIPGELAGKIGNQVAKGKLACYCLYQDNNKDNEENRTPLLNSLAAAFARTTSLPADDPGSLRQQLSAELQQLVDSSDRFVTVQFDISAASGNLILSLMATLIEFSKTRKVSLRIVYAEAALYYPTQTEFASSCDDLVARACAPGDSTSSHEYGVSGVEFNELYPGQSIESRPEFIIALPAYRTERLARCIRRISSQPPISSLGRVFWILGQPPDQANNWRLDFQFRVINKLLSALVGDTGESGNAPRLDSENSCATSTLHYAQTTRKILELIDSHRGYSTSLVHMGAKMQALGVALALAVRSEVAVSYARPTKFNANHYSDGVGAKWQVTFQDLGMVIESLTQIGMLQLTTNIETFRTGKPLH